MGENIALVGVAVAFVVAVAWLLANARCDFWIAIRNGQPAKAHGRVTGTFVQELADVLAEFRVERGWVAGVRQGKRVRLTFSRGIPDRCRQRLRNVWNAGDCNR